MNAFVSIIIPVFNRLEMTRRCIHAIGSNTQNKNFEVIIVDNGSTDETLSFLKKWNGSFKLKFIHNQTNQGYAKANNQGAAIAEGSHLVLLNNDTEPQKNWLKELLDVYNQRNNVGAVGAKLLFPDFTIQHAGIITIKNEVKGNYSISPVHIDYKRPDRPEFCMIRSFQAVTGACLMISSKLYHKIGGLDEGYWNGYEDVDLCFKLLEAGYENYVQGKSVVIHHESQSGPQRWKKVKDNEMRLERKWAKRITCQFIMQQPGCLIPNDAITVLLAAHNSTEIMEKCLTRLTKTLRPRDEVVIVDINTKKETLTEINKLISEKKNYHIISNQSKESLAKVLNQGAHASKNPYILFLDPERQIDTEDLNELFSQLALHITAAAGSLNPFSFCVPNQDVGAGINKSKLEASYLMVRRKAFEVIGGFSESSKCGHEFIDLSSRLQKNGFKVIMMGVSEETMLKKRTFSYVSKIMSKKKLTSIIIPMYNQVAYTRQCMQSIFENTSCSYELVLVDNGSTDDTLSYISTLSCKNTACARIKVISNTENVGFAKGCNQGLQEGKGDFFLILNNDVVVTPGWLEKMLSGMKSNSKIGLVGPMTNYVSGSQLVKGPQYEVGTLKGLNTYAMTFSKRNIGRYLNRIRIVGFCLLIKRSVIEKIGGFDGRFGLGNFEDDDFCLRACLAGYRALIVGDCYVHHFGSRTFLGNEINYKKRLEKNWSFFKRKWDIPLETPLNAEYYVELSSIVFDPEKHFVSINSKSQSKQKQINSKNPLACIQQNYKENNQLALSGELTNQQMHGNKNLLGGIQMTILDQVLEIAKGYIPYDQNSAAAWILERIIEENPQHADAHHELGMVYYEMKRLDEAFHYLSLAVNMNPNSAKYIKDLADFLYVAKHDSACAIEYYERLIELQPKDFDTAIMLAHLYMAQQNIQRALHFYQRSIEIDPKNEEVRTIIERLKNSNPSRINVQSVESLYAKALERAQTGDKKGAICELKNILSKNPAFTHAYNDLGVLHYEIGDKEEAIKYYERAIELDSENPVYLKNLAEVYWIEKKDAQAALEKFVMVLKNDPADIEALLGCGLICMSLGKDDDAREFFNSIITLEPWNQSARQSLEKLNESYGPIMSMSVRDKLYKEANDKLGYGDVKGAIEKLNELVIYYPDDGEAHNDLGVLNYENGSKEMAVQCYEKAIDLEPENVTFIKNLADFYFMEEGRAEDAMRLYIDVLEKNPHDVECLLAIGFVCNNLNKSNDARSFFKQVLEVEPWNQTALQALAHIEQKAEFSSQSDSREYSSM